MKRSILIPAVLSELSTLRNEVSGFLGNSLDDTDRARVVLAIDEAVSNIITHGYNSDETKIIEIDMESATDLFKFIITDTAPEYNPLESEPLDIDKYHDEGSDGGLGIDIIRRIMEVRYEKNPEGGNRLILIKEKINENK
jgi:anti-sigma regulatory factor (Ser/Thr protein kinase)